MSLSTSRPGGARPTREQARPGGGHCAGDDFAREAGEAVGVWRLGPLVLGPGAQVLAALAVVVVLGALVGAGMHHLVDRLDERPPEPWRAVSSHSPGPTAPAASPEPTPSGLLSAQDQALREAALAAPRPERPAGMDEFTPEGAIATAEYLLSLYPYIYATGDLEAWHEYCPESTALCSSVTTLVTELHSSGGWADPWAQEVLIREYAVPTTEDSGTGVRLTLQSEPVTMHSADGSVLSHEVPGQEIFTSLYVWNGTHWTLTEGEFTS